MEPAGWFPKFRLHSHEYNTDALHQYLPRLGSREIHVLSGRLHLAARRHDELRPVSIHRGEEILRGGTREMNTTEKSHRLRLLRKAFLLGAFLLLSLLVSPKVSSQNPGGEQPIITAARTREEQVVQQFSEMRYEEDVLQQKMKNNGGVEYKRETVFDSIFRTRLEDGHLR